MEGFYPIGNGANNPWAACVTECMGNEYLDSTCNASTTRDNDGPEKRCCNEKTIFPHEHVYVDGPIQAKANNCEE